jgi:NAD(P)-dependent dehydrogenase (short-subunit alcohol dehydrogenase family)
MIDKGVFGYLMPLSLVYTLVINFIKLLFPSKPTLLPLPTKHTTKPICIVTGANTGIGFQTAKAMAARGYTTIIACRSEIKGKEAVSQIDGAEFYSLDLSSFVSVREFVKSFTAKYSRLDVLVNNAGLNTSGESADGLDLCFHTNFLGHFLLTTLLNKVLLNADAPRVVNLSSVMHHFGSDFKTVKDWTACTKLGSPNAYADSKLAAVLFSKELNRRFRKNGLRSIAVNPGAVNSDIWRNLEASSPQLKRYVLDPLFRALYLSTEQGATCSIAAAVCTWEDDVLYLQPYWFPKKSLTRHSPEYAGGVSPRKYGLTYPLFEMMGVAIGYAACKPRLPGTDYGAESAKSLWDASVIASGGVNQGEL